MIVESVDLHESVSSPKISTSRANLVFLATFIMVILAATPFVLHRTNQPSVALLSPLPDPGTIMPPVAVPDNPAVAVAEPATKSPETKVSSDTGSNSTKNSFVLPAGQSEFDVYNPKVSAGSYIYLIPITKTNSVVSVKNKTGGKFTVAITPAENVDLTVDYLLINQ